MEVDRHVQLFADIPERLVARVVIGWMIAPHHRNHDRAQPVLLRPANLRDGLVDVVERQHQRDAAAALGRHLAELRQPAVMRPRPRPLQRRVDAARRQAEARAEGRGVHLRDAVGKDHLAGDPIAVEHLDPLVVIPGAGELGIAPASPRLVDLLHEEHLLGLARVGDLDRQRRIEGFAELRIEILAIALGRQPGMTVRGDDEET